MNFNSTTRFFTSTVKVDMTVEEPTMIHIPTELWYEDGYTYTVVELQGVVRKDVKTT